MKRAHGLAIAIGLSFAGASLALGCDSILGIPADLTGAPEIDASGGDVSTADGTVQTIDGTAPIMDAGLDTNTPDGTPLDSGDSGPIFPKCNVALDFQAPVLLTSVSSAEQEGSPRLSEDELTISFDGIRTADGGSTTFDLFYATRTSITDSFGPAERISGTLNTEDQEYSPCLTTDGLGIFFERQLGASGGISRIFTATRPSLTAPFTGDVQVGQINSGNYTGNPFVRGDGTQLLYVSADSMRATVDAYLANFVPGTGYASTMIVMAPNGEDEQAPVISKSGLALYYASSRTVSGLGSGTLNIWVATRASTASPFTNNIVLNNVNTTANDKPGWISADGCRLYMTSDRTDGGLGYQDIYVASRPAL